MSFKVKRIKSKFIFPKIKFLYTVIFIFYFFCLTIFFLTNGSFEYFLKQHLEFIFLPLIIPFFFSFLGVYSFSFENKNGLVEINNQCMLFGDFNDGFRHHLIIPIKNISGFKLNSSFFGLRKTLFIRFKGNSKKYKKGFNISLLSKDETKNLFDHLTTNTTNNKYA
jgi:hypothetical protein